MVGMVGHSSARCIKALTTDESIEDLILRLEMNFTGPRDKATSRFCDPVREI